MSKHPLPVPHGARAEEHWLGIPSWDDGHEHGFVLRAFGQVHSASVAGTRLSDEEKHRVWQSLLRDAWRRIGAA